MDTGLRPGKLIRQSLDELNALAERRASHPRREALAPAIERDVLTLLKATTRAGLHATLASLLMRQGVQRFVLETIAPLNRAVGEAWMRGELQVFEEHLYTEQLQVALRGALNAFPRQGGTPRVLLTTVPGEQHGIGLLMVEALVSPEGAQCISLGTQTPFEDIRRAAARAQGAHCRVVVLGGVSAAAGRRRPGEAAHGSCRRQVALWAGGEITRRLRKSLPGVLLIADIGDTLSALKNWRTETGPSGSR